MDNELTELGDNELEHFIPSITTNDLMDIFQAYDISFIRYFGSDLFYVEMVDGEPLVPLNPKGSYPQGIERLFDLMARERLSMLSYKDEKFLCSYFPVDSNDL
ncbi:hypothetical protein [Methanolobus profundi]|uniref:Uncharacterized protein n=1 Tax=Methanolobus profundi TaxID=487685 RepID=A0A1I4NXC3_9EURY|nr:hypothetical protein [Methanolobus profundi]SFM20178.1 hypothetical protein SAMN04488696_0320 [Methanolobus profundi]